MPTLSGTPARLRPGKLARIAHQLATHPGEWRPLIQTDPRPGTGNRLLVELDHELWLRSWLPGQWTGPHDHGPSYGAFAIAVGELYERTFAPGGRDAVMRVLTTGRVRTFAPGYVHDLVNASAKPALSVHVYSPRLEETGRYEGSSAGLIRTGAELVNTAEWERP